MVYVLLNSENKRVHLLDGSLTPAFDFPVQALKYAEEHCIFHCQIRKV